MHVIVDFALIPVGKEVSLSPYIAACQDIFRTRHIEHQLHAYGTNLSGDWDLVMDAIKACHETVHSMGAVRIASTIKLGTRTDKAQSLKDRIDSVMDKIDGQ